MKTTRTYKIIISELLIFIALTLLIFYFRLDLYFQEKFFRQGSWYLAKNQPWKWFYHYGSYPSILLTAISIFILFLSYYIKKFISYRRQALLVILTLVMGPGFFINGVFKDHWGRPRPRQLQQFDGKQEFHEVWQPGEPGRGKSFPCGHASMGFHFIVVYYIFKRRNKIIRYGALTGSLVYGTLIGIARMAQGAHFASDVVWAAGFTYLSAAILYYYILKIPEHESKQSTAPSRSSFDRKKRTMITIVALIVTVLFIWIFLFSKPFYNEFKHTLPTNLDVGILDLSIRSTRGDIIISFERSAEPLNIQTKLTGFGYPKKTLYSLFDYHKNLDTLHVDYTMLLKGIFYEVEGSTSITIRPGVPVAITALTENGDIFISLPEDSARSVIFQNLNAPKGSIIKKTGT